MSTLDIRWQQRFDHYQKALRQLEGSVELSGRRSLSELEKLGLIKVFGTSWGQVLKYQVLKYQFVMCVWRSGRLSLKLHQ